MPPSVISGLEARQAHEELLALTQKLITECDGNPAAGVVISTVSHTVRGLRQSGVSPALLADFAEPIVRARLWPPDA